MRYVDVFVSHKAEDTEAALALKERIAGWGFSCWVDAEDEALRANPGPRELADHIRERLRTCRCLIYAFSAASAQSKWMPWELGFFDGRWGDRQVLLYDLAADGGAPARAPRHAPAKSAPTVQEYLEIYEAVPPAALEAELRERCSTRALANRADVDADRAAALAAGALRNPLAFWIGLWEWAVSVQMEAWRGAGLPAAPPSAAQAALAEMRRLAEAFDAPPGLHGATDAFVGGATRRPLDRGARATQ